MSWSSPTTLSAPSVALDAATGSPLKRVREAGALRQGFHRLGPLIVELVQRAGLVDGPASFWGLVLNVEDLDVVVSHIGSRADRPGQAGRATRPIDRHRARGGRPRTARRADDALTGVAQSGSSSRAMRAVPGSQLSRSRPHPHVGPGVTAGVRRSTRNSTIRDRASTVRRSVDCSSTGVTSSTPATPESSANDARRRGGTPRHSVSTRA